MKSSFSKCKLLTSASLIFGSSLLFASADVLPTANLSNSIPPTAPVNNKPLITPSAPTLNAKAYILIDVNSGKIIAEKNSDQKLPPASLTKMMTLFVISNALQNQQIHLTDTVRISRDAWKTGGSRMFVKEGQQVSIEDLLKGIIVDSGNDACVAMAEHLGGSEQGFSEIMNQQAQNLGMKDSHFTDSTGLPDENHYTTAKDLAILGRALILNFPQYYEWYKQKWFTYNGIRQPNRNRLLWRDNQVDGIKTGHTNEAGFCLVSSAKRDNMRLLAVVMGSPTDAARADDSERLLNYGFRFFETHQLYKAGQTISEIPIYKGAVDKLNVGLQTDQFVTIPSGQYQRLSINTKIPPNLQAPIEKGQKVGELVVQFDNNILSSYNLYALQAVPKGGMFTCMKDSIRLAFRSWFG
ncbi:D-alanyl-D-alanine carboxypeptidase family protein [Legionella jordanis]|uniref:serine-type D-Ala-D-Ala carboxypeptidase n=1 Tax=Legionella jordanis TaxID=456 RepID=A0A0W0VAP4_9GAMM|nr:D-alanyl-D-alanine carboxypeptidase family protein [Legionella jordanis]KTD17221.1 D-alanyl-D-alanine carboxypeptidase (penicillin-binding protein 5) [Legionella jordanis]RMX03339.1 D-alanyl-D-alanine carboxypeptidase [Legionella jordanis]RMX15818.1 D-alanyl-D-alanine carboxypeptidase [Legionella jordanis]VEH12581.1 D-alanyl-D-alanine carboxypeptidase (penicillin-binding protein 5) [Legionella jordanis]HAT8713345.1 serine-type D-Ala-D-Ala carboxypeptidase [Legionella jordanis]